MSDPRHERLVPVVKGRGERVFVEIPPFYNVAEFGENLTLYYPPSVLAILPANGALQMLHPDQVFYDGAAVSLSGTAGVTSTVDRTHEFVSDMPAWAFLVKPLIIAGITVGAGNTVTLSVQVIISLLRSGQAAQVLYDETLTETGITADVTRQFHLPPKGLTSLIPQHGRLRIRVIVTATRTAGASNTTAIFHMADTVSRMPSSLAMHIHAALDHAQMVYGGQKAS